MKKKSSYSLVTLLGLASVALSSCSQKEDIVFYQPLVEPKIVQQSPYIREVKGSTGVNLIWVIDNSGSMGPHQQNVITNAELFMDNFIKSQLDWKLGLVSTDISDSPYLGFSPNDLFDHQAVDPVVRFRGAVAQLGTSGDGTERPFESLKRNVNMYTQFVRKEFPTAVIVVTDEPEQSNISQANLYAWLKTAFGPTQKFFAYAVLDADELGCDGQITYTNSPYQKLIESANAGKAYPLCAPDFGKVLGEIGEDIAQRVTSSAFYLKHRPKLSTISVSYKGQLLKPGLVADGGVWFYDYIDNAIVFHDMSFANGLMDKVDMSYQIDDGIKEGGNKIDP